MAFNPDRSIFVAMADFGPRGIEAIVDPALTRADIVQRIATGDFGFEHIVAVHEYNPIEGWSRPVTLDIFEEVSALKIHEAA
jgi:hypothetical protein